MNLSLDDAVFLLTESAGKPNHVVALELFQPPEDAGPDYLADLFRKLLAFDVKPLFGKQVRRRLLSPTGLAWAPHDIEIDYHVRRQGLPVPGRVRELLEAVSLQHGVALDRNRPLWECHLIEGLDDGRFALSFKAHHALADGMTLAKHIFGGLADTPGGEWAPPWADRTSGRDARKSSPRASARPGLATPLKAIGGATNTAKALVEMAVDSQSVLPYAAPWSILNSSLTGARRFAGDKWEHARLKQLAEAVDGTVNDVVLAMCGGALRAYLDEIDALPDRSLIAMVPVSLRRPGGPHTSEGNSFGAILCDLRTEQDDPMKRLSSIVTSTRVAKARMSALSPVEAAAVSRLLMAGVAVGAIAGVTSVPRQPFNLIISNVPASSKPLYMDGSLMTDLYPISMISEGQAANITVTRYGDSLNIGMVGDRRRLPHLQRMLDHIENALAALEKVVDAG